MWVRRDESLAAAQLAPEFSSVDLVAGWSMRGPEGVVEMLRTVGSQCKQRTQPGLT